MFFFFFFFFNETNNELSGDISKLPFKKTGNKGEWSELYALYKLLVTQSLFPICNEQPQDERLRMPILSLMRYSAEHVAAEYCIGDNDIITINANGQDVVEIEKAEFDSIAKELLKELKKRKDSPAFEIPSIEDFRRKTYCVNIKGFARSLENGDKDKSDIFIALHDAMTGQTPRLGFSIKSEIGSSPTLLNSSGQTNFKYKLSKQLPAASVERINKNKVGERVKEILKAGVELKFDSIQPNSNGENIFYDNLLMVDGNLPEIMAHLLLMSNTENSKKLDVLTDLLTAKNPLGFPVSANPLFYVAKVKRFVTEVALGMVPGTRWNAKNQIAGILAVKDTGDIDCYHMLYRSSLEDYLYQDLKFETSSTTRYKYGSIETDEDGSQYIKLNMQIRFC